MIINKGDDLILTIEDTTAKQIKIFTNGIDTITKDISDSTVKIDSTELATLKSGVIAYYLIYYTDDSSFKDGKYNRSEVVFTNYYYRDTSETYTPVDNDTSIGKDYFIQIRELQDSINNTNKKIEDYSIVYFYFNTSISELPIGQSNATSYSIDSSQSSRSSNWTEEEFNNRFKSGSISIGFKEGFYKLISKSSNEYYIFTDKISGTVGYIKLNSNGNSCSIYKDAANAVATVLDSQIVKPSSLNTNYYTPTTPKQGITADVINGNFPLLQSTNDGKYKGIINVRFQQGGKGQSEYWEGMPEIQLATLDNQLYFRSAKDSISWTNWEQINKSAKRVEIVNNMTLSTASADTYYLANSPVNAFTVNGVLSSTETYSYSNFSANIFAGEYVFEFEASEDFEATGNMLTYIYWNKYPKFTAGNRYRITIINNLATIEEFKKKDNFPTQTDNNG